MIFCSPATSNDVAFTASLTVTVLEPCFPLPSLAIAVIVIVSSGFASLLIVIVPLSLSYVALSPTSIVYSLLVAFSGSTVTV